ncbi:hypothetical protein RMATCC62417_10009 [Rhizopus microsporus]|nr:hypothetical protein RMATCC62417_10009 [Rhizopus microsporus]
MQLDQFFNIIGTKITKNTIVKKSSRQTLFTVDDMSDKFERDDDKRAFRIQEFIKTERSYVETLQTLVKYVVHPLKSIMQQKHCILNTYKCTKIFLNIDQIASANQQFLDDLEHNHESFGDICREHMQHFECYRKYLLEQGEAQNLHAKEVKSNQAYKRFLMNVNDHPEFKRRRLQDILVEPVQRISRYSMMLREILNLTPKDHPDYQGLKLACEKSKIIATMDDDDTTKAATMLLALYQTIKESPCSLINQNRSLVAHLDALEINHETNKPLRAVTLFLFTDKILVASRSSLDSKEMDLEEIVDTMIPTKNARFSRLPSKKENSLKFKGWADLECVECFEGVLDRPGSFILSASNMEEAQQHEMANITSFEHYFYRGPRLFSVIPQKEYLTRQQKHDYIQKGLEFQAIYQKTRALAKEYDSSNATYYRTWKEIPTFCSVYSPEAYVKARYKNNSALVYVDTRDISLESLFSAFSPYTPWIVGLIQPEGLKGFRLHLSTLTGFAEKWHHLSEPQDQQTIDFERVFWNNLLFLNQCLQLSQEHDYRIRFLMQQALSTSSTLPRPKSMSISRATSIPALGKLFNSNEEYRSSRKRDSQARPLSSPKQTTRSNVNSWNGASVQQLSNNQNSSLTSLTSLFSSKSSDDEKANEIEKDKNVTCDDLLLDMIQERNDRAQQVHFLDEDEKNNTFSSRGSSNSMASSFSMVDDEEENELDNESYSHLPVAKVNTNPYESLDNVLKLMQGFEDEMQQEWQLLMHKY